MSHNASAARVVRMVFEQSSRALLVIDDDGRILLDNQRARAIRGLDLEALFQSRAPEVHRFRAKLRVGWEASSLVCFADRDGVERRLVLEGRPHGSFYLVSIREAQSPS